MTQIRMTIDGLELAALHEGAGGRPMLLVHGFTGCKEDFAEELAPLAELGYHAVAPELRGHGDSDAPPEESAYSLDRFAADMFAVADHLGWDRFDLLGHSMGGMIVQKMALGRPERISRLVLMNTHHGVLDDVDHDLVALGVELARTQGLEVIQQILAMATKPEDNIAYERTCAERPGYREFAERKMLRCSAAMYAAMLLEMTTTEDRLERLAAMTVPTLVQVGQLDTPFLAASHAMAGAIDGARLDVFDGGGHCPQFETTVPWRESLHGFLAQTEHLLAYVG